MAAILKFFKRHLLTNPKSDWAETWWEASQWHRDSKLLKSFHSDIQDGGHLEILQTTSPHKFWLSWNLMGGITVTQRFKIVKIVPFRYPQRPSWNSSNDISSQTISPIELKHVWRHHSDTEIQNCQNHSILLSKMATTAAILKFFKRHLLLNPKSVWAETWWEASQWHRNSKLLKSFHSDIQDGHHCGHLEILQMSGWAETWWEASGCNGDSELLNHSVPVSKMTAMVAILKLFKQHQILNC